MGTTTTKPSQGVIYQLRTKYGRKVDEFKSPEELKEFLDNRNNLKLEIWVLASFPGKLLYITTPQDFINSHSNN